MDMPLLNPPYSEIASEASQLKLDNTKENNLLLSKLEEKKIISSFKPTDDSIKVNLYRRNRSLKKKELIKC